MYLFDAIEYFKTTDNKDDNYIFFDNDVLIHSNLNDIDSLNQKFDYMVYDITHECKKDNNWIVNFNDISESYILDNKFKPIGGEFIAIKGDFISKFIDSFKSIKTINGLYTEEHYLSYLSSYVLKNYNIAFINNDDGVIKRIWTTFKYNNRSEKDIELKILHLPSEKLYGLYWLSKYCIKNIRTNKEYSNEVALIYTGVIYKLNIKIRKVIARILYRYIY